MWVFLLNFSCVFPPKLWVTSSLFSSSGVYSTVLWSEMSWFSLLFPVLSVSFSSLILLLLLSLLLLIRCFCFVFILILFVCLFVFYLSIYLFCVFRVSSGVFSIDSWCFLCVGSKKQENKQTNKQTKRPDERIFSVAKILHQPKYAYTLPPLRSFLSPHKKKSPPSIRKPHPSTDRRVPNPKSKSETKRLTFSPPPTPPYDSFFSSIIDPNSLASFH